MNNQQAAHTPMPWKVENLKTGGNFVIVSKAGYIASMIGNSEIDKNNAAYIVRAVNAHESYKQLVKELTYRIEECPDCEGSGMEHDTSACPRCGGQGKVLEDCTGLISHVQAIARAEGSL